MIQTQIPLDRLYLDDEIAWYDAMVELLDAKAYDELDYNNLREFLNDMSVSQRREVLSRLIGLVLHILKWEHQPDMRSRSWLSSIIYQQQELEIHMGRGILRNHANDILEQAYEKAIVRAVAETGLPQSKFPPTCQYTVAELLTFDAQLEANDKAESDE